MQQGRQIALSPLAALPMLIWLDYLPHRPMVAVMTGMCRDAEPRRWPIQMLAWRLDPIG